MLLDVLIILVGVILVALLAKIIVDRSIALAHHFGVSGTFVGLTVLSIGTSIPEIMGHIVGSVEIVFYPELMQSLSSLLIGASTGSDIFQQTFVLAIVGILGTVVVKKKELFSEMGALIAGAVAVFVFSLGGFISRLEGGILFLLYVAYLWYLEREEVNGKEHHLSSMPTFMVVGSFLALIACFGVMAFVTAKVLDSSRVLITILPLSASFFGVVILGVASALPELMTAMMGILRGEKGISSGVLIGSNITNPLLGIGLGALISGYSVPLVVTTFDLPVKIFSGILIYFMLARYGSVGKKRGIILLCVFLAYLTLRLLLFPADVF